MHKLGTVTDPVLVVVLQLAVLARVKLAVSAKGDVFFILLLLNLQQQVPFRGSPWCHGALCQGVNPFCSSMELYRSLVVLTKYCSWSKSIALELFCISSRDTHAPEHRSIYLLRSTLGFQFLLKDKVVRQRWTGCCCNCMQMCYISVTEWTFTT